MKVVLAQLNYHIGNFAENLTKIAYEVKKAEGQNADLIVFSELAVTGYPPQDLLEFGNFIEESSKAIQQLASISNHIGILIGAPTLNPESHWQKTIQFRLFSFRWMGTAGISQNPPADLRYF